ncbi:MAG: ABC transporter substrate-binding protein [Alphaproteobacteria bacterium]|nr:ABC transporter substrate-binding protein [Alphaproteobacteria bacterium]
MSLLRLLTTGCALAAGLAAATTANAQDKVNFRLNWILYGFHTPFYLGVERGYYKEEGIDLTIGEGQGSVRAAQTVGAKGDMFGLSDGPSVINVATKGAAIRAVMSITSSSPYAIGVRADAGVKSLKDLEGKTIATAPGEAGLQLLGAVWKANGVDGDKVKILRVEGAGKNVAIAEKRVEALMAGLDNQSITLPRQGVPLVNFGYADYGVNTVGLQIHTHEDTIKGKPDLVRRFVKATVRSFEAAIADPMASIKAGQKAKSDLETELSLEQLKVGISLMPSKASKGKPIGYMAPEDWSGTLDLMKQYMGLETSQKATDFYTNEFVPNAPRS